MRIYQAFAFEENTVYQLDDKASHHVGRVLRAKVGDAVQLFNGLGGEYHAVITRIDKKKVEVRIDRFHDIERESPIEMYLAQGISRSEKMDFVIQKAVELGVTKITPLLSARCNVKLSDERGEKRYEHWLGIIQHACEQSGRNRLPLLEKPIPFTEWILTAEADLSFILNPHSQEKLPMRDQTIKTVQLLLGPEGGFTGQEVDIACENSFKNLQIGPRILRTETATVAALTVLQYYYGDLA